MTDVIDKTELLEEINGDIEFLNESFEMLEEDAPTLLTAIRSGMESADAEAIWKNAHTMKSMVGNFYAQPCFDAAYTVETQGRQGNLEDIGNSIDVLETEMQKLLAALRDVLM